MSVFIPTTRTGVYAYVIDPESTISFQTRVSGKEWHSIVTVF
jgi:hypothetical protein